MPRLRRLLWKLVQAGATPKTLFPPGHFYDGTYYGGGSLWIEKIA